MNQFSLDLMRFFEKKIGKKTCRVCADKKVGVFHWISCMALPLCSELQRSCVMARSHCTGTGAGQVQRTGLAQ